MTSSHSFFYLGSPSELPYQTLQRAIPSLCAVVRSDDTSHNGVNSKPFESAALRELIEKFELSAPPRQWEQFSPISLSSFMSGSASGISAVSYFQNHQPNLVVASDLNKFGFSLTEIKAKKRLFLACSANAHQLRSNPSKALALCQTLAENGVQIASLDGEGDNVLWEIGVANGSFQRLQLSALDVESTHENSISAALVGDCYRYVTKVIDFLKTFEEVSHEPYPRITSAVHRTHEGITIPYRLYTYPRMRVAMYSSSTELKNVLRFNEPGEIRESETEIYQNDPEFHTRDLRDAELLCMFGANASGNCLDIGTSRGQSAYRLSTNLRAPLKTYTVNILPEQYLGDQELITHLLEKDQIGDFYRERGVTNIEQHYADTLRWTPPDSMRDLAVAFVDGAHDEEAVFSDSCLSWARLAPGGFILWHDFSPLLRTRLHWIDASMRGVERFLAHMKLDIEVLHVEHSWIGVLRKPL